MLRSVRGEFLASRGWDMSVTVDLCSLDCAAPGYRRVWTDRSGVTREIILCSEDAEFLEAGVLDGDYQGAPLPPDSLAGEWPWVQVAQSVAGLGPGAALPTRGPAPWIAGRWVRRDQ
jgi:hypothetical protein